MLVRRPKPANHPLVAQLTQPASQAQHSTDVSYKLPDDRENAAHNIADDEDQKQEEREAGERCSRKLRPDKPLTVDDVLLLLADYAIRFGLSWKALESLQQLVNVILQEPVLPETTYSVKKECGLTPSDLMFPFYCHSCMCELGTSTGGFDERRQLKVQCSQCKRNYTGLALSNSGSFFVLFPLRQ